MGRWSARWARFWRMLIDAVGCARSSVDCHWRSRAAIVLALIFGSGKRSLSHKAPTAGRLVGHLERALSSAALTMGANERSFHGRSGATEESKIALVRGGRVDAAFRLVMRAIRPRRAMNAVGRSLVREVSSA